MRRFFSDVIADDVVHISGPEAHHISSVLRLQPGAEIIVVGNGLEMICTIESCDDKRVEARILSSEPIAEPSVSIALYQALAKGAKLDLVVQKTTELGVSRITPVLCERSVSRPSGSSEQRKLERLRRIAGEASKQSGRGDIPEITSILTWQDAVASATKTDLALVLTGWDEPTALAQQLAEFTGSALALLVGPEGGFTDKELGQARAAGAVPAGLGRLTLRTETAGIVSTAIAAQITGAVA